MNNLFLKKGANLTLIPSLPMFPLPGLHSTCSKTNSVDYLGHQTPFPQITHNQNQKYVVAYPYFNVLTTSSSYAHSNQQVSNVFYLHDLQYQFLTAQAQLSEDLAIASSHHPDKEETKKFTGRFIMNNDLIDESVEKIEISFDCSVNKSYKYRNVYKSVVRHMNSYANKYKAEIKTILFNAGYEDEEIESTYLKLNHYNEIERQKGCKKMAAKLVKYATTSKTPYSYILKETLEDIKKNLENGRSGKIIKKNLAVYKEICNNCYEKVLKILDSNRENS